MTNICWLKTLLFFVSAMATVFGQTLGGPMHGKAVVCYVASWATYRPDPAKFTLDDLEPSLCTHIVYSFAGLDERNSIKSLDPYQDLEKDYGKAGYKRLVDLKERYPHLKVTIAIGGWNEGSLKYSNMASTPETRAVFIQSVMYFLDAHKFDGLDLDWEYPTKRDGKPYDRANYVALVKELKEAFEPRGYILTAALGAGKATMESAYDLQKLSRYLDLIHLMCYDYHGTWDGFVGANAPLRGTSEEDLLSVEFTIKYMIDHGVSPYKMVLGLPMYGRTFILKEADITNVTFGVTPVKPKGFKGPYTGEDGFMGYNEICMAVTDKTSKWTQHWDAQSETPYLRDGERIIAYDDARSIAIKVKMAIDYGLGGLMVWSIDTDDFKGVCNNEMGEAYIDFIDRYHKLMDDPLLKEALKTLNLPDASRLDTISKARPYVLSDGRLFLRLPESKYSNYPLMQTINDASTLALEEKRIMDEMKRIAAQNEIEDTPAESSSRRNIVNVLCYLAVILLCLFK